MNYQATKQENGGISKAVDGLGKAVGVIAAILGTPVFFKATSASLYAYLAETWGKDMADLLIWVMGAAEAYVIYAGTALLFSVLAIWAMPSFATSRFRG